MGDVLALLRLVATGACVVGAIGLAATLVVGGGLTLFGAGVEALTGVDLFPPCNEATGACEDDPARAY